MRSYPAIRPAGRRGAATHFIGGLLALLVVSHWTAQPAGAQSTKAVSSINGFGQGTGSSLDDSPLGTGAGSFVVPLGDQYGVQFDFGAGDLDSDRTGDSTNGYGIHLFWREPKLAMVGVRFYRVSISGRYANRYILNGEYYLEDLTFSGEVGFQQGAINNSALGSAETKWYPLKDLLVQVGGEGFEKGIVGRVRTEYQLQFGKLPAFSVFADGGYGNRGFYVVTAGVRVYLGGGNKKSLKDRHRENVTSNPIPRAIENLSPQLNRPRPPLQPSGPGVVLDSDLTPIS